VFENGKPCPDPVTQGVRYAPRVHLRWLIETDVFPETAARVTAALDRRGIAHHRYHDAMRRSDLPPADAPVIFWGSLGAAYAERVARAYTPGAIGDAAPFHCSAYYPALRAHLANADAMFTTVRALVSDPGTVLAPIGSPARVFVRPDSPLKPFSGRVIATAALDRRALDHGYYYEDEELPIVVSTPKHVTREWRFVIAGTQVIAGCEYLAARTGAGVEVPAAAAALAAEVAAGPMGPAPLYVLDVGEVDGSLRAMELNPFSGADFYDCDADAIVEAASAVGARLYLAVQSR